MIEEICKRWGYRPHEVLEMPVWVLRMADVLALRSAAAGRKPGLLDGQYQAFSPGAVHYRPS